MQIIGFCGHPQHGKTTAQNYLKREFGVTKLDDSHELRVLSMYAFGLTEEEVTSQEGKSSLIPAYGKIITVREAMGLLGKEYETKYGDNYWIERAIQNMTIDGPVSFGSIRMSQGRAVKDAGGIVVCINDSRKMNSDNDFDQFDLDLIDYTVHNSGSIEQFELALQVLYTGIKTDYGWNSTKD